MAAGPVVGNSTRNGHNVIPEIRWLGTKRIGQFHLKDLGYLGDGTIEFAGILAAIRDIGSTGLGNLETSTPSRRTWPATCAAIWPTCGNS